MKNFVRILSFIFGIFLFPSYSFAEARDSLQGKGNTVDAVKVFNRAVASNGGSVDGNAVTEYSSVGDFGKYQAKMYAESEKGKVNIRITVKRKEVDVIHFLTVQSGTEMDIAKKINAFFIKAGYIDTPPEEVKK